jgi:hypothetical protein
MTLGIKRARILAHMRLNPNCFFWNGALHELMHEDKEDLEQQMRIYLKTYLKQCEKTYLNAIATRQI